MDKTKEYFRKMLEGNQTPRERAWNATRLIVHQRSIVHNDGPTTFSNSDIEEIIKYTLEQAIMDYEQTRRAISPEDFKREVLQEPPPDEYPQLATMSDMDLVFMQAECRRHPEDKEFLHAILRELKRRQQGK